MKPGKVRISTLIGFFLIIGLMADLLPSPALGPGLVSQTSQWLARQWQTTAQAETQSLPNRSF